MSRAAVGGGPTQTPRLTSEAGERPASTRDRLLLPCHVAKYDDPLRHVPAVAVRSTNFDFVAPLEIFDPVRASLEFDDGVRIVVDDAAAAVVPQVVDVGDVELDLLVLRVDTNYRTARIRPLISGRAAENVAETAEIAHASAAGCHDENEYERQSFEHGVPPQAEAARIRPPGSVSVTERRTLPLALFAAIFYFSEGFPYGIVGELLPLYMRSRGASLTAIGMLSTVSLVWTLKLLWAPAVDRLSTYGRWIRGSLLLTAASLAMLPVVGVTAWPFWAVVSLLVFASATHDVAVDGLTIVATPVDRLGMVNSIRVAAYRIAMIAAGSGLAAAAGWGWDVAFLVAAAIAAVLFAAAFFVPLRERTATADPLIASLVSWFRRPGSLALMAVVLLYRLGDAALYPMVKPFWVDRGFSPAEIGAVTTALGMALTIAGAAAGGWFVMRSGIARALLFLGIAQLLSNAGYALVAQLPVDRNLMYAAAAIESFCSGLGTAAFLSFLMAICDRQNAATEYALLSAGFVLTRSIAGAFSGVMAEAAGYAAFFWSTLVLGAPGILLLIPLQRTIIARAESARAER